MNDFWKTLAESAYLSAKALLELLPESEISIKPPSNYTNIQQAFIEYREIESRCLKLLITAKDDSIPLEKKGTPKKRKIKTTNGIKGGSDLTKDLVIELDPTYTPKLAGGINKTLRVKTDVYGRVEALEEFEITAKSIGALTSAVNVTADEGLTGGGSLEKDLLIRLGDTTVTPGSYGGKTTIPKFKVDQKGRIVYAENLELTLDSLKALSDKLELKTSNGLTGGGLLKNDLNLALSECFKSPGDYGDSQNTPKLTINTQGRITAVELAKLTPDWESIKDKPIELKENVLELKTNTIRAGEIELILGKENQGVTVLGDWHWKFTEGVLTEGSVPFSSVVEYDSGNIPLDLREAWGSKKDTPYLRRTGLWVALEGLVTRTTNSGNIITTLPNGFRPHQNKVFSSVMTISNTQEFCQITVKTNGDVILTHPSPVTPITWVSLDNIAFHAN
jgi:hypothetical protein